MTSTTDTGRRIIPMRGSPWTRRVLVGALLVTLAALPLSTLPTFGVLPGRFNSVGSLQILAMVLVGAALAVTLDLQLGYLGLTPFGHALYFALSSYVLVLLLRNTSLGLGTAALVAILVATTVAAVVGSLALRTSHIGYSMISLAFLMLFAAAVEKNLFGLGGDVGVALPADALPAFLAGIKNTRSLYWLALVLLVAVYALSSFLVRTQAGHIWKAIRENELRVTVMGINTTPYKLAAITVSGSLAGVCGVLYALIMGGANPHQAELFFSLGLVLMVVLGGRGILAGAALGGAFYVYLDVRLAALANSSGIAGLPDILRIPLSEPQLLLGISFVLIILFMPQGIVPALLAKRRRREGQARDLSRGDGRAGQRDDDVDRPVDGTANPPAVRRS